MFFRSLLEQEWSNFKNETAKYQGKSGREYVGALHEVWAVMHRLQEGEERENRNREIERHLREDRILKMEPILAGTSFWGRAEAEFGNAVSQEKDSKKQKQMVRNPKRPDFRPRADSKLFADWGDSAELPRKDLSGRERKGPSVGALAPVSR